jgi:hypothetical protein
MRAVHCIAVASFIAGAAVRAQQADPRDLDQLLDRVGSRVQQYYAVARTVVSTETVLIQPLAQDMTPEGHSRRLVYELRVDWEPPLDPEQPGEAKITRELVSVDGRAPRPKDEPGCMDPRPVSPEPLEMLLPTHRHAYAFRLNGSGSTDGRRAIRLEYRSTSKDPAVVEWTEHCVHVELPSQVRGRVWVDADTDDVLRLDESLTGMFEMTVPRDIVRRGASPSMTIERADSSILYRRIKFADPDETWVLPASIDSLTVIRNGGVPRVRTMQTFSNYRRFTTGGRIVNP